MNEFKQKTWERFVFAQFFLFCCFWFDLCFIIYSKTDEFVFIVIINEVEKAKSHTRKTVESIKYLRNNH